MAVGVFIALAAESWWSEREDRRFEREIREDMLVEFESNKFVSWTRRYRVQRRKLASLLRRSQASRMRHSWPFRMLFYPGKFGSGSFASAGFDPELGSVQALVESGNLGAVGDRELRLRLSRWDGLLEQCRRKNTLAVEFDNSLTPLIVRAGSDLHWSEIERRELRALLEYCVAVLRYKGCLPARACVAKL